MDKIKFRGRDKRGNVFYGTYNPDMGTIDDWDYASCHAVDEAEQLVFVDENGNEVYSGDTVVDSYGEEFIATLMPMMIDSKGVCYEIAEGVTLKEAGHEHEQD